MAEGDNDTCLELALEGEKLCKAGKCRDGVAFFEAALQVVVRNGTESMIGKPLHYGLIAQFDDSVSDTGLSKENAIG